MRDPESFRGMSPSQIMTALVLDEMQDRQTHARAVGAKCVRCLDTGMDGGRFCSCSAGAKIAYQANSK